jgi:hypothetical protein
MRLSWYADTGVAVFSIWQAGMCTGTFRLPIGDLSRMIEILERGPSPQGRGRAPVPAAHRGQERGRGEHPADEDEIGLLDAPSGAGGPGRPGGYAGAQYTADYGRTGQYAEGGLDERSSAAADRRPGDHGASHGYDGYDGGRGAAEYPPADYGSAGYGDSGYERPSHGDASRGSASYGSDHLRAADYGAADYGAADYGAADYGAADYGAAGYQPADYGAGQPGGHEPAAYDYNPAGYGRGGYAEDEPTGRRGGHAGPDYPPDGYGAGAPDYLTSEHPAPGYHEGMRADSGPDYPSTGYAGQSAFPAGSRQRDDSRFPPDPGSRPTAETDGIGYADERFVPPYVQGGGDSYLNDNRARAAGYPGEPDAGGYPADGPPVSPSGGYHEEQWPGEAYSYGAEYRRR